MRPNRLSLSPITDTPASSPLRHPYLLPSAPLLLHAPPASFTLLSALPPLINPRHFFLIYPPIPSTPGHLLSQKEKQPGELQETIKELKSAIMEAPCGEGKRARWRGREELCHQLRLTPGCGGMREERGEEWRDEDPSWLQQRTAPLGILHHRRMKGN